MEIIVATSTEFNFQQLLDTPVFWFAVFGVFSWVMLFVSIRNGNSFLTFIFGLLALGFSVAAGILLYPILIAPS